MGVRRILHTMGDAWRTYRRLRFAAYAIGAVGGLGASAAAGIAALKWRLTRDMRADSPEFADETRTLTGLLHLPDMPRPPAWLDGLAGPLLAAAGLLLAVWLMSRLPMPRPDNPFDRDARRLFDDADRAWLEKAVGGRCEHRMLGLFRCPRKGEQMDHHYPWSKGGATDRHNLVYLCARHNRRKSDRTPTLWGTWLLYRARLKYLPPALRGYAWPDGRSRENDQTIEPEEDDPWQ